MVLEPTHATMQFHHMGSYRSGYIIYPETISP
jgi:hypothetical protein